jgi:hypothetical protein
MLRSIAELESGTGFQPVRCRDEQVENLFHVLLVIDAWDSPAMAAACGV